MAGEDFKVNMSALRPNARIIVDGKPATMQQITGLIQTMTQKSARIIQATGNCTTTTPEGGREITICNGGAIRMHQSPVAARMDVVEFGPNNTSKNYYLDIDLNANVAKAGCKDQAGNVCK